jgi:hypothetical protein
MNVLSETSCFIRTWCRSKAFATALSLCVAALPVAIIHSPRAHVESVSIATTTSQTPRIVESSFAIAEQPTAPSQLGKWRAELVDNSTGSYNAQYAADATSTNTLDWSCIRHAESQDNYRQVSGAYGILTSTWLAYGRTGVPGNASIAAQDAFALRIFAANNHRFSGSWNDLCTMNEGLR